MVMRHKKAIHGLSCILFLIYIFGIVYFMFFSERYGRVDGSSEYRYNLVLFQEINRFIQYRDVIGTEGFIVNIFGNVLAFAPFGFFLPIITRRRRKFLGVTGLTFLLSLSIETLQLVSKVGCFDVDDMLMNTVGGIIGYIVFCICYYCIKPKKKGVRRR